MESAAASKRKHGTAQEESTCSSCADSLNSYCEVGYSNLNKVPLPQDMMSNLLNSFVSPSPIPSPDHDIKFSPSVAKSNSTHCNTNSWLCSYATRACRRPKVIQTRTFITVASARRSASINSPLLSGSQVQLTSSRWLLSLPRLALDTLDSCYVPLSTTVNKSVYESYFSGGRPYLVKALAMEDMLAFSKLSNLFSFLVIAQADQTTLPRRNRYASLRLSLT